MKSAIDRSVNWAIPKGKGHLETRFVRRADEYIIAYVSSHNGCKMGCRMCYLTQQRQTSFSHTTKDEYTQQVSKVIDYYDQEVKEGKQPPAQRVNINFMARGEPLANKTIIHEYPLLFQEIEQRAKKSGLIPRMNISTIMPHVMRDHSLIDIIDGAAAHTQLYYSLYSVNQEFRKKWLPNSLPYPLALDKIKEYQEFSNQPITLHWAFIKGENDNYNDIVRLAQIVKTYELFGKFNIVRYNPPPGIAEKDEPDEEELENILLYLQDSMRDPDNKSKIVPRVGKDVYASCGMFIPE